MAHTWEFFRAGGFDQVSLDSADDLLNLKHLDQKLWVSLACPTTGIEFDGRTLALIDTDHDGRVRAPELLAAIAWAAERLGEPKALAARAAGVPLADIKDEALRALAQGVAGDATVLSPDAIRTAIDAAIAQAQTDWEAAGEATRAQNQTAADATAPVRAKLDDFFARCRIAAYDGRATEAMAGAADEFAALAAQALTNDNDALAARPLAAVAPGATVPLADNALNPAWSARIAAFAADAVTPLIGARETLGEADWLAVKSKLADYDAWLAAKPAGLPDDKAGLADLERLAHYVRDLMPLANNFVAFRDFYQRTGKAIFQVGTLYFDARSAELCVTAANADRHAQLAGLSNMYLIYCDCTRGADKMQVAAAFTAGDSDQLMVGRNGVFYDRAGNDWDATVTKIVDQPISLRQAFWSPYKKLARFVSTQIQKLAAAKSAGVEGQMAAAAVKAGQQSTATAAPPPPPPPVDMGKFVGIFAAIGLALGAIGTALAALVTGILGLAWWKIPLVFIGIMVLISAPSVVMAWFKLRTRALAPLLDANGWAVNARARINIPFGTVLTRRAELPPGAQRSTTDPYAESEPPWKFIGIIALIAFVTLAVWTS